MHGGQVWQEGRGVDNPSGARHAGWKNPKIGPDLGKRGSDQARRGKLAFAGTCGVNLRTAEIINQVDMQMAMLLILLAGSFLFLGAGLECAYSTKLST
jgi:hypothetical protein